MTSGAGNTRDETDAVEYDVVGELEGVQYRPRTGVSEYEEALADLRRFRDVNRKPTWFLVRRVTTVTETRLPS